jgi:hypothetical protein
MRSALDCTVKRRAGVTLKPSGPAEVSRPDAVYLAGCGVGDVADGAPGDEDGKTGGGNSSIGGAFGEQPSVDPTGGVNGNGATSVRDAHEVEIVDYH